MKLEDISLRLLGPYKGRQECECLQKRFLVGN